MLRNVFKNTYSEEHLRKAVVKHNLIMAEKNEEYPNSLLEE